MVKILVIDDASELREEIETLLDFEGYEVLGADNGNEGLSLAKSANPDLIICDIDMPDVDGYEVFKQLHREEQTELIPFIFLSAKSSKSELRAGMNMGADDYLTKPFEQDDLLDAIQSRLLRSSALQDASNHKARIEKDRLIRRISHELRNPITSMKLATSLIKQLMGDALPPHMSKILGTYESGVNRLQRLTEQMLIQVKLESDAINEHMIFETGNSLSIDKLIHTAIEAARRFAFEREHIELRVGLVDASCLVFGVSDLLVQAVAELIANALDFSNDNRAVVIRQWAKEEIVSILVIDEGEGIPSEELDEVLQPFHRAKKDQDGRKGLGLGLSLAYRIIDLHGGKLKISSSEIGTSVLIQLPILR